METGVDKKYVNEQKRPFGSGFDDFSKKYPDQTVDTLPSEPSQMEKLRNFAEKELPEIIAHLEKEIDSHNKRIEELTVVRDKLKENRTRCLAAYDQLKGVDIDE